MFSKHWKKIALALTGFFWAGCSIESEAEPMYGVPARAECFNDSITTGEGHTFKIITCTNGNKYFRSPNEANTEATLPRGVQTFAPRAGGEVAYNCTEVGDICIERNPNLKVEDDSLAGCHPVIDCPPLPE